MKLTTPIKRPDQADISSVEVRKPTAGELRGLKITDLFQMDVTALIKLLPRVTVPALTSDQVAGMDPCDLASLGGEVIDFLASPALKAEAMAQSQG